MSFKSRKGGNKESIPKDTLHHVFMVIFCDGQHVKQTMNYPILTSTLHFIPEKGQEARAATCQIEIQYLVKILPTVL